MIYFRKWLRHYSMFYVVFSALLICNTCIGISSAPFYSTGTDCILKVKTDSCSSLFFQTLILYIVELIGSSMLGVQGLLGLSTVEQFKKFSLLNCLQTFNKIAIATYILCIIARTAFFFMVMNGVEENKSILYTIN